MAAVAAVVGAVAALVSGVSAHSVAVLVSDVPVHSMVAGMSNRYQLGYTRYTGVYMSADRVPTRTVAGTNSMNSTVSYAITCTMSSDDDGRRNTKDSHGTGDSVQVVQVDGAGGNAAQPCAMAIKENQLERGRRHHEREVGVHAGSHGEQQAFVAGRGDDGGRRRTYTARGRQNLHFQPDLARRRLGSADGCHRDRSAGAGSGGPVVHKQIVGHLAAVEHVGTRAVPRGGVVDRVHDPVGGRVDQGIEGGEIVVGMEFGEGDGELVPLAVQQGHQLAKASFRIDGSLEDQLKAAWRPDAGGHSRVEGVVGMHC